MMRLLPRVGCVVLAAGAGSRFHSERPKLLQPFGAICLLQRAVDNAARSYAASCTLVVGAHAERLLCAIDPRRCAVMLNQRWKEGLGGSIRTGLAAHDGDDACILAIADQPFVTTSDLNNLIQRFAERRTCIVALRAKTTWGSPMLFPRSDFSELARLQGDSGAKRYASRQSERVEFVEAARPDAFADVDTRADYDRLVRASF